MTEQAPTLSADELAMMAAFEARTAESPTGDEVHVPAALRDELEDYVVLTRRIEATPLDPVAPSVRAAVMSAAVAQIEGQARPTNPFVAMLSWWMRPGPALIGATALALGTAFIVRPQAPGQGEVQTPEMVAMQEVPARLAPNAEPAPAAASSAAPSESPSQPQRTKRSKMFAAQPASLSPKDAPMVNPAPSATAPAAATERKIARDDAPPRGGTEPLRAAPAQMTGKGKTRRANIGKPAGVRKNRKVARRKATKDELAVADEQNAQNADRFAQPPPSSAPQDEDVARQAAGSEAESMDKAVEAPANPRWKMPPPSTGQPWKLRAADTRKLAQNAYHGGRNRAPAAPATAAAQSAPPRPSRQFASAGKRAPRSASNPTGRPAIDGNNIRALRARYERAKSDQERKAIVVKLLHAARSSGDAATVAWAGKVLRRINAKLAIAKRAAKRAQPRGKTTKSAPDRPTATKPSAKAKSPSPPDSK